LLGYHAIIETRRTSAAIFGLTFPSAIRGKVCVCEGEARVLRGAARGMRGGMGKENKENS
jgi:hypothetical protein